MRPDDNIAICRAEYDRLVAALNENKDLKEELRLSREAHDETRAACENKMIELDAVTKEKDAISGELHDLRRLFVEKNRKVEELEREMLYLQGFRLAVETMAGNT